MICMVAGGGVAPVSRGRASTAPGAAEDLELPFLKPEEIAAYPADGADLRPVTARKRLRETMQLQGLDGPGQTAGHFWAVACVSLEISQRCNLDCSLCYLSDHSEATHDLPLGELRRRIDRIVETYGPGTVVQVSGGEPTLRRRDELVAIVRDLSARGLVPALFTNGIRATRDLLSELKDAGLRDVAFHVDMTQHRTGYASERALNDLRRAYIERAKGLGLRIMFNTTIFAGNYEDVPDLAGFFIDQADSVALASFQIQAETGRGLLRGHAGAITQDGLMRRLEAGAGTPLSFNVPEIGHPDCNRYTGLLVVNGRREALFDDGRLWRQMFRAFRRFPLRAQQPVRNLMRVAMTFVLAPVSLLRFAAHAVKRIWRLRAHLIRVRGRVEKISFHIHNFMDETRLDRDRCAACIFKVATAEGAISMCVHNAKRDSYILQPVPRMIGGRRRLWDPMTGQLVAEGQGRKPEAPAIPRKRLKGRLRKRPDPAGVNAEGNPAQDPAAVR